MGGAVGPPPPSVQAGEQLWRLIENTWFQPDATGQHSVIELAFIDEVSFVRASFVTLQDVDAVKDKNGNPRFVKHGIAILDADAVVNQTGGHLRVTPDSSWPTNAHVLFIRKTGGKNLKASHPEVTQLTDLANANPLLRPPKA